MIRHLHMIFGLATYLPGFNKIFVRGGGSTNSARYCYSVWLRHLMNANEHGLKEVPKMVAELGPGESVGIGLAALLSGVEKYYAFDVVDYIDIKRNLVIFEELFELFKNKIEVPGRSEFPKISPSLTSNEFPLNIISEEMLNKNLSNKRIERIKHSIMNPNHSDSLIKYQVPWYASNVLKKDSIDFIYSQAVLEHVDDLVNTYQAMWNWLKPAGLISHQIDFKCHRTAKEWNGHWTYSDFRWKLIRGNRPYLLNRAPYSEHQNLLEKTGFKLLHEKKKFLDSAISRKDLAQRFASISDDDLLTSGAYILANKHDV